MKRVEPPLPRPLRGCGRSADAAVARGGWGVTARYCLIGIVRTASVCLMAAFAGQAAALLRFN